MLAVNQKLSEGRNAAFHWYGISINTKSQRFEVLDSLRGEDDEGLRLHASEMIKHIKVAWSLHFKGSKTQVSHYPTIYPDVPRQNNG